MKSRIALSTLLLFLCLGCDLEPTRPVKVRLKVFSKNFFVFDPELYPEYQGLFPIGSKGTRPGIGIEMDGSLGVFDRGPKVDREKTTWVPRQYGHLSMSLYATNSTLEEPMVLLNVNDVKDEGHELGVGDTVLIELDAVEVFCCQNGYQWRSGDFPGRPVSPAFTTLGEPAHSVTFWAEFHVNGVLQRTIPEVISLQNIKQELTQYLEINEHHSDTTKDEGSVH